MTLPAQIVRAVRQARDQAKSPLCAYVYDRGALRRHVGGLVSTLPERCRLFYAMKANCDRTILHALFDLVAGFEVASIGEAMHAREIGAGIPILFGGPGKTDEEIAAAVRLGIHTLHVESLHELRRAQHIAAGLGRQLRILLRVNVRGALPTCTLRMGGATQFGLDEVDVPAAVTLIQSCPNLLLRGFHFHSISNNLDAASHVGLVRDYLRRAADWTNTFDLAVDYLNVGGGIGVNYAAPEKQFEWPVFVRGLKEVTETSPLPRATILFECGRYVTAFCGYYAVEVLDIKRNHGKPFVIIRGGTHHCRLPASWQHSQPFTVLPADEWRYPFPRPEVAGESITIAGQLCTPKDILARDCPVERVRVGDVIVFSLVGAYGWSISHHDFLSHPHPDQIYVDDEAEVTTGGPAGTREERRS